MRASLFCNLQRTQNRGIHFQESPSGKNSEGSKIFCRKKLQHLASPQLQASRTPLTWPETANLWKRPASPALLFCKMNFCGAQNENNHWLSSRAKVGHRPQPPGQSMQEVTISRKPRIKSAHPLEHKAITQQSCLNACIHPDIRVALSSRNSSNCSFRISKTTWHVFHLQKAAYHTEHTNRHKINWESMREKKLLKHDGGCLALYFTFQPKSFQNPRKLLD